VGLDEGTALVVDDDGSARVVGAGRAWLVRADGAGGATVRGVLAGGVLDAADLAPR
jgi:cyanophycinase-like exopeptidase